jgi:hypothetical protein
MFCKVLPTWAAISLTDSPPIRELPANEQPTTMPDYSAKSSLFLSPVNHRRIRLHWSK